MNINEFINENANIGLIVENDASLNRFERIDEAADSLQQGVLMRMHGTFIPMDVAGINGRWYSYEDYAPKVADLQPKIKSKELFGEIEHPERVTVPYDLVSHRIDEVYFDKPSNAWKGTISILDTEKGRHLYNIAKTGAPLYVSHRALGSVDKKTNKGIILKLLTWDVTSNPSFQAAKFDGVNKDAIKLNESFTFMPLHGEYLNEAIKEVDENDIQARIDEAVGQAKAEMYEMLMNTIKMAKSLANDNVALNESIELKEGQKFEFDDKTWTIESLGDEQSKCKSGDDTKDIDNEAIKEAMQSMTNEAIAVTPAQIVEDINAPITIQDYIKKYKYKKETLHINDLRDGALALAKSGLLYDEQKLDKMKYNASALLTTSQADEMFSKLSAAEQEKTAEAINESKSPALKKFLNENVDNLLKMVTAKQSKPSNALSKFLNENITKNDTNMYANIANEPSAALQRFLNESKTMSAGLQRFLNESKQVVAKPSAALRRFLNESDYQAPAEPTAIENAPVIEDSTVDLNVIDSGNQVVVENPAEEPLPYTLAKEYFASDKSMTFDDFLVEAGARGLTITPEVVLNAKTALAQLEAESVINESVSLTAKFINENAQFANESTQMQMIRAHLPANYQFMFDNLNESAKMVLQEQANMYNLNESNVAEFIESRNWQQIANSSINENATAAIKMVSSNNKYAALLQSIRAGKQ